jgi:hypothetical protein
VYFIVRKTTSELDLMILTTLYLVGAKNTDMNLVNGTDYGLPAAVFGL